MSDTQTHFLLKHEDILLYRKRRTVGHRNYGEKVV